MIDSIPQGLRADKSVTPFIARAVEVEEANPVVSYYCKIFVLEYLLSNKLHTQSTENEQFAVKLLDETEAIHNDTLDELLHRILADKSLSTGVVLAFTYKLFNSSLEDLNSYKRENKAAVVQKIRATLNFLSVLGIFANDENQVDFGKLTGGKATTAGEFDASNKQKIKTLKFQLSRVLKDEVEETSEDDQEELERELELMGQNEPEEEPKEDPEPELNQEKETTDETGQQTGKEPSHESELDAGSAEPEYDASKASSVTLPQAPHFAPDDEGDVRLPGAPTYLPDDDISLINKSSSIQVFSPEKDDKEDQSKVDSKDQDRKADKPKAKASKPTLTKSNINTFLQKGENISLIQKHAKFAISALNYEDLETAERELREGLEILSFLKETT